MVLGEERQKTVERVVPHVREEGPMSAASFARAMRRKAAIACFPHDERGRPAAFVGGFGFCAFSDGQLRRNLLALADMIDGSDGVEGERPRPLIEKGRPHGR